MSEGELPAHVAANRAFWDTYAAQWVETGTECAHLAPILTAAPHEWTVGQPGRSDICFTPY